MGGCAGYASLANPSYRAPEGPGLTGTVTGVVDGDTFWIDFASTSIRVWGLDAPQLNQVGGPLATAAVERLMAGRKLSCRERDIDRYGRIVGQSFLPDGRDIATAMIAGGTASEYCRYSAQPLQNGMSPEPRRKKEAEGCGRRRSE